MKRTICIKGTGKATLKPDTAAISFAVNALDKDYGKAVDKANAAIVDLRNALAAAGFDKSDLKTKNFCVSVKNKSVRDKDGNYTSVFEGYDCRHDLGIAFDFTPERLGAAIGAISSSSAHPQFDISFTVKDKDAVAAQLLENAVRDAKAKASVLARASGVKLGDILTIDYDFAGLSAVSPTRMNGEFAMLRAAAPVDVVPDDISASDTVTVTWEIE